jgi:hypothetical protein
MCHHLAVSGRKIKCALLMARSSVYDAELTVACPGLDVVALNPSAIGLREPEPADGRRHGTVNLLRDLNRFALPEDESADVVLIESHWYRLMAERHPGQIADVMRNLERRADLLVGLDADSFALGFPPSALERLAIVLKFDGVYRDRDLYNYFVGSRYPGADWTEKLRPRPSRYRASDLDKLRLSVPCFMRQFPAVRGAARARRSRAAKSNRKRMSRVGRIGRDLGEAVLVHAFGLPAGRARPLQVHCVVGPTHPQRIEAVRALEGFSGRRGILTYESQTEAEATPNPGTGGFEDDFFYMAPWPARSVKEWIDASTTILASAKRPGPEQSVLLDELRELLLQGAEQVKEWRTSVTDGKPYAREPTRRLRYLRELRLHQVAVAPVGHGELTYRHGEALMTGAALVCQDLSHVEMMFPFRHQENVIFCRPDLSDLRSTVEGLLRDEDLWRRVGREGRRSYMAWARRWRQHLYDGIEGHIRTVFGAPGRGATEA